MKRQRSARRLSVLMILVLVAGASLAAAIVAAPPKEAVGDSRQRVLRDGHQFAVAVNAYDAAALVEEQARAVAALSPVGAQGIPEWLRGAESEISELRARGRPAVLAELDSSDRRGAAMLGELRANGYEPSPAVIATLGALEAVQLDRFRSSGATIEDLAPYETARRELDSYNSRVQALRSQFLADLDALGTEPLPGDHPGPNWWALAALMVAMLAVEAALSNRMVNLVRSGDRDLSAAGDRHAEQLQSVFLVARRITAAGPRGAVAATVAEEAAWTTDADFAIVSVLDRSDPRAFGAMLVPVAASGDVTPAVVAVGEGIAGRSAEIAHPESGNVSGEPLLPFEDGRIALLSVPVITNGEVTAVVVAGRRSEEPASDRGDPGAARPARRAKGFDLEDHSTLLLLAQVAGTALEHQQVAALTTVQALPAGSFGPGETGDATVSPHDGTASHRTGVREPAPTAASEASSSTSIHDGDRVAGDVDDPADADRREGDSGPGTERPGALEAGPAGSTLAPGSTDAPATVPQNAGIDAPSQLAGVQGAPEARQDPATAAGRSSRAASANQQDPEDLPDALAGLALAGLTNVIGALSPDLDVRRHSTRCKLPGAGARLLAVLVAQRQPVTVDRLADLLWPDISMDTGRNRLNVTLHRLRKALDLPSDELIVRSSDGIALVPGSAWAIDSWMFWDLSKGTTDDQVAAFDLYRSDFCSRQLAYEEAVLAERARLHARWCDVTSRLLSEDLVDARLAADRASASGDGHEPGDDMLREALSAALARAGHSAQAASLSTGIPGIPGIPGDG